jgi:hypothetical protein
VKRNIETTTQKFFDDLKDNFEEIYKLKRNWIFGIWKERFVFFKQKLMNWNHYFIMLNDWINKNFNKWNYLW